MATEIDDDLLKEVTRSCPVNIHVDIDAPEFDIIHNKILFLVLSPVMKTIGSGKEGFAVRPSTVAKISSNLRSILVNTVLYPSGFGINRGKDYYSKLDKRYNPNRLTAYYVAAIINILEEMEYVEVKLGYFSTKKSYVTSVTPTKKLRKIMKKFSRLDVAITPKAETILLKMSKKLTGYKEDDFTKSTREGIIRINEHINKYKVTIFNRPVRIRYYRVFNHSDEFNEGGRFYSFFQNIRSKRRPELKINGTDTTEIDYKSIHPQLLYLKATGSLMEGDPYTVAGHEEYRKIYKKVLMILINSNNIGSCKRAIILALRNEGIKDIKADVFIQNMKDKHTQIAKYFHSGEGLRLQFIDSKIAEYIMLKSVDLGIPILGIHDSFITTVNNEEILTELMDEACLKIIGKKLKYEKKY